MSYLQVSKRLLCFRSCRLRFSRIRKVKCDEGRPACVKCVSTGRVCEGYEVWGGGNTLDLVLQTSLTKKKLLGIISLENEDERGFAEWFRCKTSFKMQGAFGSPFWETLVMQASLEEPPIFHAMLALSSVHKRVCFGVGEAEWERDPDRLEQFTLRQYSKAINALLQPRSGCEGEAATRVALICCMLFICLEFLRGRYITANDHLQNGMKLLTALQAKREFGTTIDNWLVEAFTRMNLLAVQFGHGYRAPLTMRLADNRASHMITFGSVAQARSSLDSMYSEVIDLSQRCHQEASAQDAMKYVPGRDLVKLQERIKSDLDGWFITYKASRVNLQNQLGRVSKIGYELLFLFYAMAVIMADTCFRMDDEVAFDSHTNAFTSIINHSSKVLDAVQAVHSLDNPVFRSGSELFLFNADIGWTPPLFYTALHCRVRSIRHRAIELLRVFPSKEGIWDSTFAASVSQQIIQIEEGDCYPDVFTNKNSYAGSEPADMSLDTLVLPASRRVCDIHITLPDSPSAVSTLTCKRMKDNNICEVITRKYDPTTNEWFE